MSPPRPPDGGDVRREPGSAGTLVERLEVVRARILAAGGDPQRVRLVVVTKGHPASTAAEVLAAGVSDLGESYAQELIAKRDELEREAPAHEARTAEPCWHFVGRLQTNKVRHLVEAVGWWHSVDRQSLADELARRVPGARVLVQVDVSGEASKGGVAPGDLDALVDHAIGAGLEVIGLMGIASLGPAREVSMQFAALRSHVDRLGLTECSMGMSGDLELAVAEGATIVRVGTDVAGPRPARERVRH